MANAHEFSRRVGLARLAEGTPIDVQATPEECRAVAARLGLIEVRHLSCQFRLKREPNHRVQAHGRLSARVVQTCVVTQQDFAAAIAEDFRVRFVPAGTESDDLDIESDDEIPYEGDTIDLGEAATEQLALALDPFPRQPGAELPEQQNHPDTPFAKLSKLSQ